MKTKVAEGKAKKAQLDVEANEAVKSFVYPVKLSEQEKREADETLKKLRGSWKQNASEEELLLANILQLKFQLEDYLGSKEYDKQKRLGYFLKKYLKVLGKKSIDFAKEIRIHKTLISQIINDTRVPNEAFLIRLEIHSNKIIPAEYWLQLVQKEEVHALRSNSRLRKIEMKNVTRRIPVKHSNAKMKG